MRFAPVSLCNVLKAKAQEEKKKGRVRRKIGDTRKVDGARAWGNGRRDKKGHRWGMTKRSEEKGPEGV